MTKLPPNAVTMLDGLRHYAQIMPNKTVFTFLESDQSTSTITFSELAQKSNQIGQALLTLKQDNGRILLLLPPGLSYISLFFGILKANLTAVTAYPPDSPKKLPRLQHILQDAQPDLIVTMPMFVETVIDFVEACGLHSRVTSFDTLLAIESENERPLPTQSPDQLAFIQYSSGSTADPKGVLISHRNIFANLATIQSRGLLTPNSSTVLWLPPYHDMGLIFGIFLPLYTGHHSVLMAPFDFIKRPFLWLKALMDYEAEISGIPNFAFNHCVRHITPEQKAQLDLSKLEVLFCGSEPVRLPDLNQFVDEFKSCGLHSNTVQPVYGLAEATLFVSSSLKQSRFSTQLVDRLQARQGKIEPSQHSDKADFHISCGSIVDHHLIKIVDPKTLEVLSENQIGELWLQGDSVAVGYHNQPKNTEKTFQAKLSGYDGYFLRTGDLGYLCNGEIYITGRLKELLIVNGRNVYPQDIEQQIESIDEELSRATGVVFTQEEAGHAKLVAVYGLKRFKGDYEAKAAQIRQSLANDLMLQVDRIAFIKGSTPRTTSGKRQRLLTKEWLENGKFDIRYEWERGAQNGKRPFLHNTPYQAATSSLEANLVTIWESVLNVTPIGIHDHFLELGGDSLKAAEVYGRVEQNLNVSLPIAELMASPTIEAIAKAIQKQQSTEQNRVQINL